MQQQREKHRFSTTVMEVLQSLLLCMYGLRLQVFLRYFALKWILEIYIKVGFKAAVFLKNDTTNWYIMYKNLFKSQLEVWTLIHTDLILKKIE